MPNIKFTDKEINDFKEAGKDYVGDWSCWGNNNIDDFDGQAEAYDLAQGEHSGVAAEIAAGYIYEGMLEMKKEIRKG